MEWPVAQPERMGTWMVSKYARTRLPGLPAALSLATCADVTLRGCTTKRSNFPQSSPPHADEGNSGESIIHPNIMKKDLGGSVSLHVSWWVEMHSAGVAGSLQNPAPECGPKPLVLHQAQPVDGSLHDPQLLYFEQVLAASAVRSEAPIAERSSMFVMTEGVPGSCGHTHV